MKKFAQLIETVIVNIIIANDDFSDVNYIEIQDGNIGDTYNFELNRVIPKQPFIGWTLDVNFYWVPPIPIPYNSERPYDVYIWSNYIIDWVLVEYTVIDNIIVLSEEFKSKMSPQT